MDSVLSARAEAASRLLFQTLALHDAQTASARQRPGHQRLGASSFDGEQVRRQATFLRLVSITESFCVDRLLSLAEEKVDTKSSALSTLIWNDAFDKATGTWPAMKDAFNKWHQVKPDWSAVTALTEARNAIAHGLGTLTRRQQRSTTISTTLKQVGITLIDLNIVLSESDLRAAARICADLIGDLDEKTRSYLTPRG